MVRRVILEMKMPKRSCCVRRMLSAMTLFLPSQHWDEESKARYCIWQSLAEPKRVCEA